MVHHPQTKEATDLADHVSRLLPLPADRRDAYLNDLSVALARELRELLAFESTALDLSQAAGVSIAQTLLTRPQPERLGRWKVDRPLGQGGMGTVYLVSRKAFGVTQQAAAKVGFVQSPAHVALAAIQREADALSRLQHGNVATLLDFGVTDDQEPFVVSEFVEGELLLDYARSRSITRQPMLRLYQQLLGGVSAVHAQLVLHLDIKPSNVLVTADGTVKLIDFGLAGILTGPGAKGREGFATGYTHAYASPEQLEGRAVTVQSDVFSLGRLLEDMIDTAVDGQKADLMQAELMAIIGTATQADPTRRYGSVSELGKDIEAVLEKRPVSAHPGRRWYRWQRFVGRHWLPLSLGFATIVALAVGLVGTGLQYRTTMVERDRALRLLESESATSDFMTSSLRTASVFGGGDADTTVGEMIEHMVRTLPDAQKMSPRARAWLAGDLAAVLTGRGEMALAIQASELAVASASQSDEVEDDIAQWTQLALTAGQAHQYDKALAAAEQARRIAEPLAHWRLPWAHLARMQTLLKMKRWQEVEATWPVIASIPTDRASVRGNIDYMRGTARIHLGAFAGAATDLQSALARYTSLYGEQSAPVADTRYRQFQLQLKAGDLAQARARVPELRGLFEQSYGTSHYRYGILEAEVGLLYFAEKQLEPARAQLELALDQLKDSRRSIQPTIGFYQTQLARVFAAGSNVAAAERMLSSASRSLAELKPPHIDLVGAVITQGEIALLSQQHDLAADLFTQSIEQLELAGPSTDLSTRALLGLALAQKNQDQCEQIWNQAQASDPVFSPLFDVEGNPCIR